MLIYILNLCTIVGVDICALDGGAKNQRHLCDIPLCVVVRFLYFGFSWHLHGSESSYHQCLK